MEIGLGVDDGAELVEADDEDAEDSTCLGFLFGSIHGLRPAAGRAVLVEILISTVLGPSTPHCIVVPLDPFAPPIVQLLMMNPLGGVPSPQEWQAVARTHSLLALEPDSWTEVCDLMPASLFCSRVELRRANKKTADEEEAGREEPAQLPCNKARRRRCFLCVPICVVAGLLCWSIIGVLLIAKTRFEGVWLDIAPGEDASQVNVSFAIKMSASAPFGHEIVIDSGRCAIGFTDSTSPFAAQPVLGATRSASILTVELGAPIVFDANTPTVASAATFSIGVGNNSGVDVRKAVAGRREGSAVGLVQCALEGRIASGALVKIPFRLNLKLAEPTWDSDEEISMNFYLRYSALHADVQASIALADGQAHGRSNVTGDGQAYGRSMPMITSSNFQLNATGAKAFFLDQRLHIESGADRPLGQSVPVGPISISTDLSTTIDGTVDLQTPHMLLQAMAVKQASCIPPSLRPLRT